MSDLSRQEQVTSKSLDLCLNAFLHSLEKKGRSPNTIEAYGRDLAKYVSFIDKTGISDIDNIERETISDHLKNLRTDGLSESTIGRNLTSIKRLHHFAILNSYSKSNPSDLVDAPKIERNSAPTHKTTETKMYVPAKIHCPRSIIRTTSSENAEKVVKAPIKPTVKKARISWVGDQKFKRALNKNPRIAQPKTLEVNVPHGKVSPAKVSR